MPQPSKGATGCGSIFLFFFGMPFLGLGAAFLFKVLRGWQQWQLTSGSVFALVLLGIALPCFFIFVGGAIMYMSIALYRSSAKTAALAEENPHSPWLWREDWAEQRIRSSIAGRQTFSWLLAVYVTLVILPVVALILPSLFRLHNPLALPLLAMCGLLVFVLFRAIRAAVRRRNFGKTCFVCKQLPFSPGGEVAGQIHIHLPSDTVSEIKLSLRCVRRVRDWFGGRSRVQETTQWETSHTATANELGVSSMGKSIPVHFILPADVPETKSDANDGMYWRLHAESLTPGIGYSDDFDIPVYRVTAAVASVAAGYESFQAMPEEPDTAFSMPAGKSLRENIAAANPAARDLDDLASEPECGIPPFVPEAAGTASMAGNMDTDVPDNPANPEVEVTSNWEGTVYFFPALRNRGAGLALFAVTGIFAITEWLLLTHGGVPVIVPIMCGMGIAICLWMALHVTFMSYRIVIAGDELKFSRSLLGLGSSHRMMASQIASVRPVGGGRLGSQPTYQIRLRTRAGQEYTLADMIRDRQEARWIVYSIEKAYGLAVDTRVDMSLVNRSSVLAQQQLAQTQTRSPAVKIVHVVFVAGILFFYGHFLYEWHKKASPRTPDLAEMRAALYRLSPQQQAEQLLASCIAHKPGAREIFLSMHTEWAGRITETENLKNLEQRASYSKDLYVRAMQADVALAAAGYEETPADADRLESLLGTEPETRAQTLFLMGMMAEASPVNAGHIHDVLLDAAEHDSDESVRVAAVEGLRFLKTDQALEDEFYSFTHDASFAVRDRAGCNVADCGIFTRVQRMHILPKVIALAEDPSTTGQMQQWTFMTLQAITDQKLPPDAAVWRKWYNNHGAELEERFAAQPNQVSGDE